MTGYGLKIAVIDTGVNAPHPHICAPTHAVVFDPEETEHSGGRGGVAVEESFDEAGKDRRDHAEGEHVERHGEENKRGSGAPALGWMGRLGFCHSDEFGFGEERVGRCSRLGRVLGRIGHVICGGYEGGLSASLREFCGGFLENSA